MPIDSAEISARYPVLFHMATYGSWASIQKPGLLSSSSLVKLFELPESEKQQLLEAQRREGVKIRHAAHGTATLRDQKPLSQKSLDRCLIDCDAQTWYRMLNERVFFWLSRDRLKTLMSAAEYVNRPHTVLHIDTASLLAEYTHRVELAAMNTGNTRPFAHPRGTATFRSLAEYPYEARRKHPDYSAIVELTVLEGVPDLSRFVLQVEHAAQREGTYQVEEVLFKREAQ